MTYFKLGDRVDTPEGTGTVVHVDEYQDDVLVKHDNIIDTYEYNAYYRYSSDRKDLWCYTEVSETRRVTLREEKLTLKNLAKLYG